MCPIERDASEVNTKTPVGRLQSLLCTKSVTRTGTLGSAATSRVAGARTHAVVAVLAYALDVSPGGRVRKGDAGRCGQNRLASSGAE